MRVTVFFVDGTLKVFGDVRRVLRKDDGALVLVRRGRRRTVYARGTWDRVDGETTGC